jgi:hypothetical protein
MDKTQHSKYWIPGTNESPGGPAWEYTDYLGLAFRVRYTIGRQMREADVPVTPGSLNVPVDLWIFEWDILPTGQLIGVDDEVFELNYQGATAPTITQDLYMDRFRVVLPEPHWGEDNGRLEYWGLTCNREVVRG